MEHLSIPALASSMRRPSREREREREMSAAVLIRGRDAVDAEFAMFNAALKMRSKC